MLQPASASAAHVAFQLLRRLLFFPMLLPVLHGCIAVRDLEHDFRDVPAKSLERGVAVVTIAHKEGLARRPKSWQFDYWPAFLTLGLWPFPQNACTAQMPAISDDPRASIAGTLDERLSERIGVLIGEPYAKIDWRTELHGKVPSISALLEVSKKHDAKTLYLVVYNEYTCISWLTPSWSYRDPSERRQRSAYYETHYGSILMASRVLVDVSSGALLLDRQRLGEKYFWAIFLTIAHCQATSWPTFYTTPKHLVEYVRSMDQADREAATEALATYLVTEDLGLTRK